MPVQPGVFHAEALRSAPVLKTFGFLPRWLQTSVSEANQAEINLLKSCRSDLDLVNTPVGECKHEYMHSVVGGSSDNPNLVCLPGYGAGVGFFFRNLDSMCSLFRMHAVDWLGTGLSGRPNFTAKTREETEDFFLDAFETWREKTGLEKFVLMGHSMGGYLAANYALRHPERVEHLILVSPAAVDKRPEDLERPKWAESPWTVRGQAWRTFSFLWNVGATPQMAIRGLGPWGRKLVGGYVNRRFTQGEHFTPEEASSMEDYFYHITASRGSGEFGLRHIMAPFAWGKAPLEDRLAELKVPVMFIYGESDWMDPSAAMRACKRMERARGPPQNACDRSVRVLPTAGHFVFLDQPKLFEKELVALRKALPDSKAPTSTDG
ncbi:hypothetical protein BSKO_00619 [Bryopsis sp. KO-2023]|nr:hypothetical protein BSKO_00619 [Bryopsis sp. KO-2023]